MGNNPSCNAEFLGLILGWGTTIPLASRQLSPGASTTEVRVPRALTLQWLSLHTTTRESVMEDPVWGKGDPRAATNTWHSWVQFSSVAQSCLTLCDPMDCSTPGFPVLHQSRSLVKFTSMKLVMPSNHLILCPPLLFCLQYFPASGSFPMS